MDFFKIAQAWGEPGIFWFLFIFPLSYSALDHLATAHHWRVLPRHLGHMSLKVLNVEFDFDVCTDSIQLLTHTFKTYDLICML